MLKVVILVAMLMAAYFEVYGDDVELEYSCNPSGTITVLNPNTTLYTNVSAKTSDGTVECTAFIAASVIIIGDCPISSNITLWLHENDTGDIITAENTAFHILLCQQIPATGVYRDVTDNSWVTNLISTSIPPSVTPMIILNTNLLDIESGVTRTTAIVGEPLLWEMDGPEGYAILPVNCTATSGVGDEVINLVYNGCSLDTYLLSHFEYNSSTERHILVADLYAFRFANSEEILILCDMLGCPNTSTACNFTCPGRKRRSEDLLETSRTRDNNGYFEQRRFIYRRSVGSRRQAHEESGSVLHGQVSVSLRVFDSDLTLINRGVSALHSLKVLTITAVVVLGFAVNGN